MKKYNLLYRVKGRIIRELVPFMSDSEYLKILFRYKMGYNLDLDNPQTFNEKLQWLKLNDIHPEYTLMVDKYEVKKYVASIVGDSFIIPTYEVYEEIEQIDFKKLPNQFVLKCTHDSGGVVICKDQSFFNINNAKRMLKKCLSVNYSDYKKEYPYKSIRPRIIAEQYLVDESGYELKDYKFFCFNGDVKFFKVDFDRYSNHRANYYDNKLTLLSFGEEVCPPDFNRKLSIPDNIEQMFDIARKLSKNIPFLRVDLYNTQGQIFFGELTFFPNSGLGTFIPNEWDRILGSWLQLPS